MPKKKVEENELDEKKVKEPKKQTKSKKAEVAIQEYLDKGLAQTVETEKAILEKEKDFKIPQEFPKTTGELIQWNDNLGSQVDQLTTKIQTVDEQYKKAKSQLNDLEKIKNKLMDERSIIKQLVNKDQDLIYKAEQKMLSIDPNQYLADLPDILRPLVKFFSRREDEILLRERIARSEAKISQRNTRLVDINAALSKAWIAHKSFLDGLDVLKNISESYRDIRMSLGKIRRESQESLQIKKNEEDQNLILKNYLTSIQQLDSVGFGFLVTLSKNRETANNLVEKVQELALKADFEHVPESLDTMVDNLSKEK